MEPMRRPVFKNPEINQKFEQLGFVLLPPLEDSKLVELEHTFRHTDGKDHSKQGWYNSSHDKDLNVNRMISKNIIKHIEPDILSFLDNYRSVVGAFLIKRGNSGGMVKPHADWALTDERFGCGLSAFLPIHRVDETTGCLWVVPGSHKLVELNRGHAPGQVTGWACVEELVFQHAIPIILTPGEILMMDNRLVHSSMPMKNENGERILISCGFIPLDQLNLHFSECFRDEWGSVFRVYQVDDAFYLDTERRLHPGGYYSCLGYRRQPSADVDLRDTLSVLQEAQMKAQKALTLKSYI